MIQFQFRPKSTGRKSYFVIAENRAKAFEYADEAIRESHFVDGKPTKEFEGWGTDEYELIETSRLLLK